jgi:hypothetical protein
MLAQKWPHFGDVQLPYRRGRGGFELEGAGSRWAWLRVQGWKAPQMRAVGIAVLCGFVATVALSVTFGSLETHATSLPHHQRSLLQDLGPKPEAVSCKTLNSWFSTRCIWPCVSQRASEFVIATPTICYNGEWKPT